MIRRRWFGYDYYPERIEHRVYFLNICFYNIVSLRQRYIFNRQLPWAKFGLPANKMWRYHF